MPRKSSIDVRWGDTDAGGLIYYPQIFSFFVKAFNAYFEPISDHLMEEMRHEGIKIPTVTADCDFYTPLKAGDIAVVEAEVVEMGETSLSFEFEVTRDGDDVADGYVKHVFTDDDFNSVRIPDEVREFVAETEDL
ncbi:acyl-CoA thioesterase [Halorutilales archaeon Cl-col2-1]